VEKYFNLTTAESWLASAEKWAFEHILVWPLLIQFGVIVAVFLCAWLLAPSLKAALQRLAQRPGLDVRLRGGLLAVQSLALPLVWMILQWVTVAVAAAADWPNRLLIVATSLLAAWVVISLTSRIVRDPLLARTVALIAWAIAALNILGLLDSTLAVLDRVAVTASGLRISALTLIEGALTLAILLWLSAAIARIVEHRLANSPNLTPSFQVLAAKLTKIVLITFAFVIALGTVGIDLTAFAVFGGAIGVGIGFGLQKVISNLISGMILLLDKSIKPGDVIAVGDTYGWINSLRARYVSVITRDGREHLIPNEDLITQRVENWSFSDRNVRIRVPFGVAYSSDLRQAMGLAVNAAQASRRVLKEPKPICLLLGFGDSAVDLELRFWIIDPQEGVANVRSEVLLAIWDLFHEHHIEIPFPQRDLHLKSAEPLTVALREPAKAPKGAD
jgi:small-conductance mechanosensitive channel